MRVNPLGNIPTSQTPNKHEISKAIDRLKKTAKRSGAWHHPFNLDESVTVTNALISSIGEGLIMIDEYGYISHINQPALDILGFEKEEMEGKWLTHVLPSFDKQGNQTSPAERPVARSMITGSPVSEIVYYKRKDGNLLPVFGTSSPFIVRSKPMGGIIVFRDITKEIQIEQAKDEFVSLASHQLRTPLTSIRFFTELLMDPNYGKLSKKQANYLNKILFSTDRMIELVSELLNISRLNLGQLEINPVDTNLDKLLRTQVAEAKPLAKRSRVKLSYLNHLDKSLSLPLDKTLLSQASSNLITNAIRYSQPTGSGRVEIEISKTRNDYKISVSDNGIGIPGEAQPKIYDRFFRADNAVRAQTEGTGLGLYLVKEIIEASGGRIKYKSIEGKGSIFSIYIPASGMLASDLGSNS